MPQSQTTMEDGVTDFQSFLPPLNLNPEDGSNREDDEEKKDGSVSAEKHEELKKEDLGEEVEHKGKDSSAKDETKGGIINNLISTLVSPMSPKTGNKTTQNEVFNNSEEVGVTMDEDGEREGVVGNNSGEGGLISNFVSNFFHQSDGGGDESVVENVKEKEDDEEVMVDEKIKRVKTEDGGNNGGGGGIIHNIVSHFPASLPDDAAPTADEASILINSLVRD